MRFTSLAFAGALMIGVTSCDPIFATQHRQALTPVPATGCLATALRASPLIALVTPDSVGADPHILARFQVAVLDRESPGGEWRGEVTATTEADGSVWATVTYSYPGFAQPANAERVRWDSESRAILETVRRACAPNAAPAVECRSLGPLGGNRRACRTAA